MANENTKIELWSVNQIVDALSDNPKNDKKLTMPKFQRSVVWTKKQREGFIDSLKSGFPIGSLLVYKNIELRKDNKISYTLIDGLQRTRSLKMYIEKPTEYFEAEDLSEDIKYKLKNIFYEDENQYNKFEISIIKWFKNLNGFKHTDKYYSSDLIKYLIKNSSVKLELDVLEDDFNMLLEEYKSKTDLSDYYIPVMVYFGEYSDLPSIFDRINSKGTSLNKYQIFAAGWDEYKIKINNTNIVNKIRDKYESLQDEGFEIEGYNSEKFNTSYFSVFEYMFGLGKYLCNKYSLLFGENSNSSQKTESASFNLTALCLKLDLKKLKSLGKEFVQVNQSKFEDALFSSINFVQEKLKPFIALKANRKKGNNKTQVCHSELQIISIIGKVFRSKYDEKFEQKKSWENDKMLLGKNIAFHYLYDIIREHWRGSGDTKAMLLCENEKYIQSISKDSWENTLDEWFEETELKKAEKDRENIKRNSVLFLKYIYSHILTVHQEYNDINFELDHIIPFSRLKKIAGKNGIPISAISNLALLNQEDNRNKSDKTIYEFVKCDLEDGNITKEQAQEKLEELEKFSITNEEMLEFVKNDLTIEKYLKYLKVRFGKMKDLFYELNNI